MSLATDLRCRAWSGASGRRAGGVLARFPPSVCVSVALPTVRAPACFRTGLRACRRQRRCSITCPSISVLVHEPLCSIRTVRAGSAGRSVHWSAAANPQDSPIRVLRWQSRFRWVFRRHPCHEWLKSPLTRVWTVSSRFCLMDSVVSIASPSCASGLLAARGLLRWVGYAAPMMFERRSGLAPTVFRFIGCFPSWGR